MTTVLQICNRWHLIWDFHQFITVNCSIITNRLHAITKLTPIILVVLQFPTTAFPKAVRYQSDHLMCTNAVNLILVHYFCAEAAIMSFFPLGM